MTSTQHQNFDREYLLKQNRKLRMQLKQSNDLKKLHQKALMQMNQNYGSNKIISSLINIITKQSNQSKISQLNQIIMQMQGKVMVLQKIATQTQQNQKQTYNLLVSEFQKLKQQNIKKQDQLHKFYEKIGQVDYISGLVTKYKQIITTTQQTMAFKKQQQQLFDALHIQQQTIKRLAEEKQKLLKINIHMKEQVQKRKDQVRNMTIIMMNDYNNNQAEDNNMENILQGLQNQAINNIQTNNNNINNNINNNNNNNIQSQLSSRRSINTNNNDISSLNMSRLNRSNLNTSILSQNPNTTLNFIKMQRQLIKQVAEQDEMNSSFTNSSDVDCPQLSILFPDKVQKIKKKEEQLKVPYLNMKKVRQMMAKRQQKMRKQWQQQKHHINPTNKIIQLQNQLDITRKQLSNQSLKFRLITDQLKILRLQIQQLQKRNQLLVESNLKLKNNYQIIYSDYQISKSIITEIQRVLGKPINKDNEKIIKNKIGKIIEIGQNQLKQEQIQLTLRNHQINIESSLHQILNFKQIFKKRGRAYSI